MASHSIDYEILGNAAQTVEIVLDPGETVIAEAGTMNYMTGDIRFETRMGDGSESSVFGKLWSMGRRMFTGESLFMTHFTNAGRDRQCVGFAAPYPGSVVPIDLAQLGGRLICQKDAFLCAAHGTKVGITFSKRLGAGFFGGEGFILQELEGDGLAFIHAGGTVIRKELHNETLLWPVACAACCLAAKAFGWRPSKALAQSGFKACRSRVWLSAFMRQPSRRVMKRVPTIASRLAALTLTLGLSACSSLLFYPEPGLPVTPRQAFGMEYRDVWLTAEDGTRLHSWWLPVKAGQAVKGTVLFLHGNGGNLAWHLPGVAWLPEQGYQVLMLDYRGYGLSAGEARLPQVYSDLQAAFAWLADDPQAKRQPLTVLGQSLGGALAVHYLAEHPILRSRLHALVLDGVPASYRQVARHLLSSGWLTWLFQVPLSWAVPDGDSAQYALAQVNAVPILIYQSLDDELVPFANGVSLYQVARPPRMFQPTRGGHVQTFTISAWRELLLRYLADPHGFVGLRPLLELPDPRRPQ